MQIQSRKCVCVCVRFVMAYRVRHAVKCPGYFFLWGGGVNVVEPGLDASC